MKTSLVLVVMALLAVEIGMRFAAAQGLSQPTPGIPPPTAGSSGLPSLQDLPNGLKRQEPAGQANELRKALEQAAETKRAQEQTVVPSQRGGRAAVVTGTEKTISAIESFFVEGQRIEAALTVKQFGYELFEGDLQAFSPSTTALVGPEYVLGPDDEFTVMVWGLVDGSFDLRVSQEGTVAFPRVGEVQVAGVPYGQLKSHIHRAFAKHYKNFQLSVAMGKLRSFQVFVVGEVQTPGSYTLSSLSTMFTALFSSGGPKRTGTLRDIQLLRNGKVVKRLDLYEFLLKGDKSQDLRLQDQDTVFVSLIGPSIGVAGHVQRPAIYELRDESVLGDLLTLAGGVRPTGYLTRVQIERVLAHRKRVALDLDIMGKADTGSAPLNPAMMQTPVQNLDLIRVFPISPAPQHVVYLKGHVVRPGPYEFKPGMRVNEVIRSLADLNPQAYTKAELSRYSMQEGRTVAEMFTVDLLKSLAGDPEGNLELKEFDVIVVRPIPESDIGWEVTLKGEVKRPGLYTITRGERLSSVLKRAGGLMPGAYPKGSIFRRASVKAAQEAQIQKLGALQAQRAAAESSALAVGGLDKGQMDAQKEILALQRESPQQLASHVSLGRMVVRLDAPEKLEGTPDDLVLENGDSLEIPSVPETVSVMGSVRNPTALHYKPGLVPGEYLNLAGGLTADADWEGAYVLKADGSAIALYEGHNRLGYNGANGKGTADAPAIDRGDAIVVPTRIEVRTRPAPMWQVVPDPSEATPMQQMRK